MNYTSAAVGVAILIATLTWFTTGRKQYTGPERGGILRGSTGKSLKLALHHNISINIILLNAVSTMETLHHLCTPDKTE